MKHTEISYFTANTDGTYKKTADFPIYGIEDLTDNLCPVQAINNIIKNSKFINYPSEKQKRKHIKVLEKIKKRYIAEREK